MCKEGDRIIFLTSIYESTEGEQPVYILAKKGDGGKIVEQRKFDINGSQSNDWYTVFWDGWGYASFAAQINVDFKLV